MNAMKNADVVLQELIDGNTRFLSEKSLQSPSSSLKKLKDFGNAGQLPKAIVLCCSDSRAPVEMIFDQDIGDLFVIRVAGNIVAPSLVGSVEFAASTFGTELVVVMGHTGCGAVRATVDYISDPSSIKSENIHDILGRIKPHIFSIAQSDSMSYDEKLHNAVLANVRASVDQLSHSSRMIEELVISGKVKIVGALLDLHSGSVSFLQD